VISIVGTGESCQNNDAHPTDVAIRVENLGKQYRIGFAQQRHDTLLLVSVLIVSMLLVSGGYVFDRMEKTFADVV
jgi:hypothetical protein